MTELRDHLVAMRADVGAAIEAVDRVPIQAVRSGRVVVADDDERILLTFCSEAGVVVAAKARVQRSSLQPEFENPLEKFRKI